MKKLLIANRGEIASRIVRSARAMGIATVAVYSDADREALHVEAADEALRIGGAAPSESYLNIDAIIDAARRSGADAVHPGYGFLSENAGFAAACADAGLIFVGPPASMIAVMGDKAQAKRIAEEAGVPVVPGYSGDEQLPDFLVAEAKRLGFPLMVKAAAGGGGRGMRRVANEDDLAAALEGARREAEGAFGDGRLLLERLIPSARHIEVQVFGDSQGNVVHLGERDCSAQRRHQKIVEETPSPFVDADLWESLTGDAVRLARAVGYVGAGTVEFIVAPDGSHHFLEMNTRLQVEHPVTEMVTGLDLVEWQIRVARGEKLPLTQEDIIFAGHAIEARLYAEDPDAGFMPQAGRIEHWRMPADVRIDAGIREGSTVSPHYDPMIAKVIVHGADRAAAVARLRSALRGIQIAGLRTNLGFLIDLAGSGEFASGELTTGTIDAWIAEGAEIVRTPEPGRNDYALAAAVAALVGGGDWFRSTGVAACPVELDAGFGPVRLDLEFRRGRLEEIRVGGAAAGVRDVRFDGTEIRFRFDGADRSAWGARAADGGFWLGIDGRVFVFREPDHLSGRGPGTDASRIVAPLAGLMRRMLVSEGDIVEAGTPLAVIEAMKMETTVTARAAGRVRKVHAVSGLVAMGQMLAEIGPAEGE